MKNIKSLIAIVGILIFAVSGVIFIKVSNDHKECETEVKISLNNNGEKVEVNKHICKEKFNF